ncbi:MULTISPECIES: hypothetical protein [unclassified Streptomyces]|uniref:hypothetical protein n=1 Tax=unclassified Streptomyces TaxID=2593676 RepID=UPI0040437072
MRWTDDSGAVRGEDPYGGTGQAHAHGHAYADGDDYAYGHEYAYGHAYAHGHERGAGAGTVPQAWDPRAAQPAPWAPWPHQAAPCVPHGDVHTAQLPVTDTAAPPVPEPHTPRREPETHPDESARPVFVDLSGRRQRRVVRAARLLVIPAGGYVALLVSTLLGGPTVSSPIVPQAGPTHPATPRATAPDTPSGTGHTAKSTGPAAPPRSGGTGRTTTAPTATVRATPAPATTAAPAPTGTAAAAPATAPAPSARGRALGSSHRPVK